MTILLWVLGIYLLIGFSFGWLLLGIGSKYPVRWWQEVTLRVKAIRQEPELILFVLAAMVLWLPFLVYFSYHHWRGTVM